MKKILHFLTLVLAMTSFAQSPSLDWVKQIGSSGDEQLNLTTADNLGNVFTTGSYTNSGNLVITKYDITGTVLWTKTITGSYPLRVGDLKADTTGNIIIVGEFSSLVDFNPSTTATFNLGVQNYSQSPLFYFILKLDALGNFVYAKQTGGSTRSICIDTNQNIYLTGTFSNSQDFDPSPTVTNSFTSFDGYSIFITKLDATASYIWNKVIGKSTASTSGFGNCGGTIILNDAINNVVVSGYFSDDVDFDPGTGITAYNSGGALHTQNPFVLKLSATGVFVWAKYFNSNEISQSNDMDFDSSGNIYTTGTIRGFMDFDSGPGVLYLSHAYRIIPYVSKMDTDGNIIWAKQIFTTDYGVDLKTIKIDGSRNIFTSGQFQNSLNYTTPTGAGTATTSSYVVRNVFVSAMNAAGNLISFNHFGGSDMTYVNSMALKNNSLYISGTFNTTVDFDFTSGVSNLISSGMKDNYIAKYSISNFLNKIDFNKFTIVIYPNPTSCQINLSFENNLENASIKIISILGQTVFEKQNISEKEQSFDVSNLNIGLYIIEVSDGNTKFNAKFIKN